MRNDVIYEVYWEGPFSFDEIKNENSFIHSGHCLYQIYGDHPCYGRDVLLYIGKTEKQGIKKRIIQHYEKYSNQCAEVSFYIGSFGEFHSSQSRNLIKRYEDLEGTALSKIESLLIYAHQPTYNSHELSRAKFIAETNYDFRIFNTYRRKSLFPEISSTFYRT